ncbi:hypothetical protein NVP1132O_59 [Vibrio phage 1.132.O._10N.222.49.F8]|nr:hypothetical protein NVP1132O_59 [Vibrio phage 1.132.O._10N.222.49.F8]
MYKLAKFRSELDENRKSINDKLFRQSIILHSEAKNSKTLESKLMWAKLYSEVMKEINYRVEKGLM